MRRRDSGCNDGEVAGAVKYDRLMNDIWIASALDLLCTPGNILIKLPNNY